MPKINGNSDLVITSVSELICSSMSPEGAKEIEFKMNLELLCCIRTKVAISFEKIFQKSG